MYYTPYDPYGSKYFLSRDLPPSASNTPGAGKYWYEILTRWCSPAIMFFTHTFTINHDN